MSQVTQVLDQIQKGDPDAAERLLPLVYAELRELARARLAQERGGQTLEPTALVHEAYLRLVGGDRPQGWDGRAHFFAAAAEAMRRILIEAARRKGRLKRGGHRLRVPLDNELPVAEPPPDDMLALDEALTELEGHDPQAAALVKLRYFAGLSHQESADALGIGRRAADRLWVVARAWLLRRLDRD